MTLYIKNCKDSTKKLLEEINSVKFQDAKLIYKSELCFYTLIMNYHKEKAREQSHLKLHQKE